MSKDNHSILTLACPDTRGIVAAVTQCIAQHGGWIVEANEFGDANSQWFFMRIVIKTASLTLSHAEFSAAFAPIAQQFKMQWQLTQTQKKKKVAILVSKVGHCLADLLFRWHSQELDFDCVGVLSNHREKEDFVQWYNVPYHYVPIDKADKAPGMHTLSAQLDSLAPDLIILARYMQILPASLCQQYKQRIINIHHSFLPSFAGAKPYAQAFNSGVKLIGATSHYVTPELDVGPIIEQDVIRVNHNHTPDDLVRLGRDIEKTVLARAVRYHLEDRILIHNNKTIVFSNG